MGNEATSSLGLRGPAALALTIAAAMMAFCAYAISILNIFYVSGAYYYDAGWHAFLVSRFEIPPSNPLFIQETDNAPSFFSIHLSPILPLWGLLAQGLGLAPPIAFAIYQGALHATLVVAGVVIADTSLRTPWNLIFRLFFGLALAFSPIALDSISYPHYELAIPVLFTVMCASMLRGRLSLAIAAFVLLLLVREDAGFHAFCFLAAYVVGEFVSGRPLSRMPVTIGLATTACAYSCAAFITMKVLYGEFGIASGTFSGSGFFDHVSIKFYQDRVLNLAHKRPELFVIVLVPLLIGALRRDLSVALGAGAVVPWVVLNVSAVRGPPGELFSYYAFPFLIVLAWPWLVRGLRQIDQNQGGSQSRGMGHGCVCAWSVLFVCSLAFHFTTPFTSDQSTRDARAHFAQSFVAKAGPKRMLRAGRFANALVPLLARRKGTVLLDDAMLSLLPAVAGALNRYDDARKIWKSSVPETYLVAYFASYMQATDIEESQFALAADACFSIVGTNIRIVAKGVEDLQSVVTGTHGVSENCERFRIR